ncbi:MAG TPA: gluconate 2-dehydrogenase subunit 3 family protein [Anaeromyxobacteraceae bacterium]|nr:gluconate 2-dehydrogenase subunit 3 family protein [Anaeromyxobacteraceae bacterium]
MSHRRPQRVSILLPGEKPGRRRFLRAGLFGTALLVFGGTGFLATRRTRVTIDPGGPLTVFSPAEAAVLLAVANRLVPEREGFPRPARLGLAAKMDRIAAMADRPTQADLRRLVRLFESAMWGFLFGGDLQLFSEASPGRQDARLSAWAKSRINQRRTGYRALKNLVYAAYYASPETFPAIGYPGPPLRPAAGSASPGGKPAATPSRGEDGRAEPPASPEPPSRLPHRRGVAKPFEAKPVEESPPPLSPSVNNDG